MANIIEASKNNVSMGSTALIAHTQAITVCNVVVNPTGNVAGKGRKVIAQAAMGMSSIPTIILIICLFYELKTEYNATAKTQRANKISFLYKDAIDSIVTDLILRRDLIGLKLVKLLLKSLFV